MREPEDQTLLGPHGEVAALGVVGDRRASRRFGEKVVERAGRADLVRGGVDAERERLPIQFLRRKSTARLDDSRR